MTEAVLGSTGSSAGKSITKPMCAGHSSPLISGPNDGDTVVVVPADGTPNDGDTVVVVPADVFGVVFGVWMYFYIIQFDDRSGINRHIIRRK